MRFSICLLAFIALAMLRRHWAIPSNFLDNTDLSLLAFAFMLALAQDIRKFFK
jgi:hypothetical protein